MNDHSMTTVVDMPPPAGTDHGCQPSTIMGLVSAHSAQLGLVLADILNTQGMNCTTPAAAFDCAMHIFLDVDDIVMHDWKQQYDAGVDMQDFLLRNPATLAHLHQAVLHKLHDAHGDDLAQSQSAWQPDTPLTFLLWNVRGLRSKGEHVKDLLAKFTQPPAVVMLTKTKLRSCDLQKRWMRQILPVYSLVASCHPSATAVRYSRNDPAVANNNSTACAGVLIAVHDDLALPHPLRRIQPPDK